ncbi:Lipopolysaccharide core heptosyltransferase RfaQ [Aquisphaera giovannonii]|uniref:Lipopolysaccharide core heptosyltransferase RfaQ n=1 Tax=Aquisphaera giovannonii TaxID=406548 RepID=A0A5B9W3T3_9BACT|nr:glycosyltransferase family 9 protein [Aquisphaera giovannonii]QEH34771.1 Lipopolysaccharide core heptosyltransferase RfaQ [Aquisphaera giovannonii]
MLHSPPGRMAILRALKLGDMLCAVPALRAIRSAFPAAEVVLVGLPWASEFVARYPAYLDGFREFPGYPGLPEREPDLARLPGFLGEMRAERFDLAIQMHGSGRISNAVVAEFGARITAGFYEPGIMCPDPATFLPFPERGLELRRLLQLTAHLGIPPDGEALEFPLSEAERSGAAALAHSIGIGSRDFVCIHGGASVPERRWPVDRFAEVADAMAGRGLEVVLTGSGAEVGITGAIARAMRAPAIDLAGRTPLGTLAAILERARLLVCNDTGVSHLADALGLPSVVISTGDNPDRWAPADRIRHRVLCRNSGVPAAEVLREALDLLSEPRRPASSPGRPLASEVRDVGRYAGSLL